MTMISNISGWRYSAIAMLGNISRDAMQTRPHPMAMCMIKCNHQNNGGDGDESQGLTATMAMYTFAHAPERIEYAMAMIRFLSR